MYIVSTKFQFMLPSYFFVSLLILFLPFFANSFEHENGVLYFGFWNPKFQGYTLWAFQFFLYLPNPKTTITYLTRSNWIRHNQNWPRSITKMLIKFNSPQSNEDIFMVHFWSSTFSVGKESLSKIVQLRSLILIAIFEPTYKVVSCFSFATSHNGWVVDLPKVGD